MNEREFAISKLQGAIKRGIIQPLYNRQLEASRFNYDEDVLKKMSFPFNGLELRAAWTDQLRNNTIYNKALNKYKKHELFHELLNINYDFSNLEQKKLKGKAKQEYLKFEEVFKDYITRKGLKNYILLR